MDFSQIKQYIINFTFAAILFGIERGISILEHSAPPEVQKIIQEIEDAE